MLLILSAFAGPAVVPSLDDASPLPLFRPTECISAVSDSEALRSLVELYKQMKIRGALEFRCGNSSAFYDGNIPMLCTEDMMSPDQICTILREDGSVSVWVAKNCPAGSQEEGLRLQMQRLRACPDMVTFAPSPDVPTAPTAPPITPRRSVGPATVEP